MKDFRLDEKEQRQRDDLAADLRAAHGRLVDAVSEYNSKMEEEWDRVQEALNDYNTELAEAKVFVKEIANEAEDAYDTRSETWQASDAGEAASNWKDAWLDIDLDELEIDLPQELSVDEPDHANDLDNLPSEVEEAE